MGTDALIGAVVALNLWATLRLVRDTRYTSLQRVLMGILVWVVPVVGSVGVLLATSRGGQKSLDPNEHQWYGDDGPL
jgi:hypothetical protein